MPKDETPESVDVWASDQLRHLRGFHADRRERVLNSVRQLAAESGYDAVTMNRVATMANVSRASLYQHFWSKDHLLVIALHDYPAIQPRPSASVTKQKNVQKRMMLFLSELLETAEQHRHLVNALLLARVRIPSQLGAEIPEPFPEILANVIGDAVLEPRRDEIARALSYAYGSILLGAVNERVDQAWAKGELAMCVRLLLGEEG